MPGPPALTITGDDFKRRGAAADQIDVSTSAIRRALEALQTTGESEFIRKSYESDCRDLDDEAKEIRFVLNQVLNQVMGWNIGRLRWSLEQLENGLDVLQSVTDESGAGCADRGDQPNRLSRAAETIEAAVLVMREVLDATPVP
jgi:hypothetical protein